MSHSCLTLLALALGNTVNKVTFIIMVINTCCTLFWLVFDFQYSSISHSIHCVIAILLIGCQCGACKDSAHVLILMPPYWVCPHTALLHCFPVLCGHLIASFPQYY